MRSDTRSDAALLAAARAGDGRAFELFYLRRRALVLAFLRRRITDPWVVADLMAEAFAGALVVVLDHERPLPDEPVAWLMTISRNVMIDSLRRGRVEQAARKRLAIEPIRVDDDDLARIEELVSSMDLEAQLESLLTPDQARALRARILDEADYPEIAGELRCSEAVVRKRVSRALKTLREAIGVGR
jgi:RNA polymerase sigma-70 factor, ECF subfamily